MNKEKSAGAVIFRKEDGKIYFLLLDYPSSARAEKSYWDLAKGHIEKDETEIETVEREVEEETALDDLEFINGFKKEIRYFFKYKKETILKEVVFYLAETKKKDIKISFEHKGYAWLPFNEAYNKLTYKEAKEVLKEANHFYEEN